jgi:methyl-accepting chemotaxis protein
MRFRTRIWLLPASAAVVFTLGLMVSLVAGSRVSAGLADLRSVGAPYLASIVQVDRSTEQFRLTLQAAASEGDVDKLKDVEAIATATQKALASMGNIAGKSGDAAALRTAFDAYQSTALGVTRAMLTKKDMGDQVQRMQQSQATLQKALDTGKAQAALAVEASQEAAKAGVQNLLVLTAVTGILALVVLGGMSWFTVKSVWREIGGEPEALRLAARRVVDGDLSTALEVAADGSLARAVADMVAQLRQTVGAIRTSAGNILAASSEIAQGNNDLSSRTERQASSIEETSASMEQLGSTVAQNADNAKQANQLAMSASAVATQGGDAVGKVIDTMKGIHQSSKQISEIISVIDGIAFQTNILALNAAVEAARAGEQGRGFAVVASEVRSLARRSAGAAKEIKSLIDTSVARVEEGTRLVDQAGATMTEVVGSIKRVTDIVGEITAASIEQSAGVRQVGAAITQMDQATQQNSALVEESAAAAESLRSQATSLVDAVAVFKLGGGEHGAISPSASSVSPPGGGPWAQAEIANATRRAFGSYVPA